MRMKKHLAKSVKMKKAYGTFNPICHYIRIGCSTIKLIQPSLYSAWI
ncbi:hypothetical protein CHCC20491_0571 [Bacillus paralicheniformis]|nr:hypothetical protein CHCC20491_0571 [Bacillus paralicheniformis]